MSFLDKINDFAFGQIPQPTAMAPEALKNALAGTSSQMSHMIQELNRTGRPPRRGTRQLLAVYNQSPRIRAAVARISHAVASTNLKAYRTNEPAAELLNRYHVGTPLERAASLRKLHDTGRLQAVSHPAVDLLNAPQPILSRRQVLQVTQQHLDLVGESFWVIENTKKGVPGEIWPVPPSWVAEFPQKGKEYYRFSGGTWANQRIPAERVIWAHEVNPENPYGRPAGMTGTLSDEIDADEHAAKTTAHRFYNNARPELLVMFKGLSADGLRATKAEWLQQTRGFQRAGLPHFTNADQIEVKDLGTSFVDLDMVELRRFESAVIRETFGIPPEILGHIENSNRSTIEAAFFLFAVLCTTPRLDQMEDMLNTWYLPRFGIDNVILLFDPVVPEDTEFARQVYRSAPYAFTLDETRELASKGPLPEHGDKHAIPQKIIIDEIGNAIGRSNAPADGNNDSTSNSDDEDKKPADDDEDEKALFYVVND